MSIHWMAWAWTDGPTDPLDRYVFLKLADNANKEGRCYPSLNSIVRETRLSESTVRRCIKHLIRDGWISVWGGGNGRGDLTQYQLHQKGCPTDTHIEPKKDPVPESEKGVPQIPISERVSDRRSSVRLKKGVTQTIPPHPLIRNEPSLNRHIYPPTPKGGVETHTRRLTRKQRKAMVGMDVGWRTPTSYPDDPKAQEISDRIRDNPETLTGEELQYMQDIWLEMKNQHKETVH